MRISDWSSDVCSSDLGQRVDALGVVHFLAGQRRVEHTYDAQRFFAAAQPMLVVLVQGVHHARSQLILLAVGDRLDRSEERRVGKECGSTCRSRWSPYH